MGPILERWLASATDQLGRLPTPSDEPRVFAPGPDPDRILLMGGGVVRGHGVTSHNLGLGGHLARRLTTFTGRGVEVDIQWRPMMSPETAAQLLDEFDLGRYDAVILILGSREAVSLMPVADWHTHLSVLMDAVRTQAPPSLPVFMVAIPQMPDFLALPSLARAAIVRRTDRLNEETEEFCLNGRRVGFLPISVAGGSLRTYGDRQTYDRWASQIAPTVARALETRTAPPRPAKSVDEAERREALRRLKSAVATPDERFDRITQTARDLLGGSAAPLAFPDDDDPVIKSIRGGETRAPSRDESFMTATILKTEVFVVQGDELVERFGKHPWVHGPERIRFYAGYPIESPDGYLIGALAVVGPQPRTFTDADESLLRELAGRAQALLWEDARR